MATTKKKSSGIMKVTLIRSPRGTLAAHKATVLGLGLRKMHQVVEVQDNPCTRGMVKRVAYLLKVED